MILRYTKDGQTVVIEIPDKHLWDVLPVVQKHLFPDFDNTASDMRYRYVMAERAEKARKK